VGCKSLFVSKEIKMERVAIVGTGIAGMIAAYLLHKTYDITVFEKKGYVGGHTHTVEVDEDGTKIPIDTGFIVFNKSNYPNLLKLFKKLGVAYKPTNMSFSVQHIPQSLEYNGSGFNGIFGQRKNLINPSFYRMLSDIARFNKQSVAVLNTTQYKNYSLNDFIIEKKYSREFKENYLLPMNSAIWSTPPEQSLNFPIVTLVQFFKNHGLLGVNSHFQWYTVNGGSWQYRNKLIEPFTDKIKVNSEVTGVKRVGNKVMLKTINDEEYHFDKVIMAGHADQTLRVLKDPTSNETNMLSKFRYQPNKVTLHTDSTIMPNRKRIWSAWNYRIEKLNGSWKTSTVYNMNILQQVSKKRDYFLSVNDAGMIDPGKVIREFKYDHPIFDLEAINTQKSLRQLNKDGRIYYCGSYFGYGFHEDALKSGIQAAEKLSGKKLWN
jgi:predicted NAD/FAD-binding protein